jgi:hypothetical protein
MNIQLFKVVEIEDISILNIYKSYEVRYYSKFQNQKLKYPYSFFLNLTIVDIFRFIIPSNCRKLQII